MEDLEYPEGAIKVLDKGFVRYIDQLGTDLSIAEAARNSYKLGTKQISEDRTLIRYLMRHFHTGPFEFSRITFHMRLPLFVTAQLVRHRTFSFNFESLRYSEAKDLNYIPEEEDLTHQSTTNKQGGGNEVITLDNIKNPEDFVDTGFGLGEFYKDFSFKAQFEEITRLSQEYYGKLVRTGLRREIARTVLPVSQYTECYCTVDLNNLFKFLRLRLDSHAQKEIRVFAQAMYDIAREKYPIACEAFEDYVLNSTTLTSLDHKCLRYVIDIMKCSKPSEDRDNWNNEDLDDLLHAQATSIFSNKREREEFIVKASKLLFYFPE